MRFLAYILKEVRNMKQVKKTNVDVSSDVIEVMTSRSDDDNERVAEEKYREAYGPIDPKKHLGTWQLRQKLKEATSARA